MDNAETIRLVLETTGTQTLEQAIARLQQLKRAGGELSDSYEAVGHSYQAMESQVESASDAAVRAAVEQTQAQRALSQALDETAVKTQQLSVSAAGLGETAAPTGTLGRGLLQGSYAVQDFTSVLSGGQGLGRALASVQNNIPMLLSGLGAGAGLAGAVSVLTVGVGLCIDNWGKLSAAFGRTEEKLPRLRDGLDGLQDSLVEITDQIDELEKRLRDGGLNFFDEEKLRRLRGLKKEGQQRQEDERLVGSITELDMPAARAIAAAVKDALAQTGGGQQAARSLMMNTDLNDVEATAIVAGAMRGRHGDLQQLLRAAPTFRGAYVDPAMAERVRREERQNDLEQAAKARQDELRDRQTEALNAAARDNEDAWRKDAERQQTEAARTARAAQERQAREQERQARANEPEAQIRAQQQAQYRQALTTATRMDRESGYGFSPAMLADAARMAAGLPGDLAANVDQAMGAVMHKMLAQQQQIQRAQAAMSAWGQRFQSVPMTSESFGLNY